MLCISERQTQDWPFNDTTLYLSAEYGKNTNRRRGNYRDWMKSKQILPLKGLISHTHTQTHTCPALFPELFTLLATLHTLTQKMLEPLSGNITHLLLQINH